MNTTEKEKFEALWADFLALVRGKLITTANKQNLSTPLANLILSDAASSWGSEYERNGKWLNQFKETEPEKAQLVCDVLLRDMAFADIEEKNDLPDFYNYAIPAVGACIGLAMSMYAGCGKLIQAISTIAPAALLYPAVKTFRNSMHTANQEKNIDSYMLQLEKYKNSIVSILS